ncbi:MAG: polyprenyl synthetase family protein [Clostridia bacterium]|nr:polyprenyl synthetase family protein [Clostridia bacterium]
MWSKYPEIYNELELLEEMILENSTSRNALLNEIVRDVVKAGGKRIRPAFVLISSKFGKYDRKKVLKMASAIEILHTATLIHDDVIDRAKLRRGRLTVSEKYGVDMALYAGDFLYTKAVLTLSKGIPAQKLDLVAMAVKTICEGEVDQYQHKNDIGISTMSYFKRIGRKTAVLFSSACSLGAFLGKCPLKVTRGLAKFGFYYGMAFQIRDDLNDYLSSVAESGKPVGNDIREGIITLPAIHAINQSPEVKRAVSEFMAKKDHASKEEVLEVMEMVKRYNGIEYTKEVLKKYICKGLKILDSLPNHSQKAVFRELMRDLEIK